MKRNFIAALVLLSGLVAWGCEKQPEQTSNSTPKSGASGQRSESRQPVNPRAHLPRGLQTLQVRSIPLDENSGCVPSTTRNLYFVFDGSGSMNDKGGGMFSNTPAKIVEAKDAVTEFLKQVPEDVNLGLWVFDAKGQSERVALGPNNRRAFLSAIDAIKVDNNTPLGEAIQAGVDRLIAQYKKQCGYGEYRLIVVTDGQANGNVTIESAGVYAAQYGFPIYTIGLYMDTDHQLRQYSVSYRAANSKEELKKALEEMAAEAEMPDDGQIPNSP